jgi:hypothetical protein
MVASYESLGHDFGVAPQAFLVVEAMHDGPACETWRSGLSGGAFAPLVTCCSA